MNEKIRVCGKESTPFNALFDKVMVLVNLNEYINVIFRQQTDTAGGCSQSEKRGEDM